MKTNGTKPLPEPMLTYHHQGPVMFIWGQFRLEISQPLVSKISLKIIFVRFYWNLPGANELTKDNITTTPHSTAKPIHIWWDILCTDHSRSKSSHKFPSPNSQGPKFHWPAKLDPFFTLISREMFDNVTASFDIMLCLVSRKLGIVMLHIYMNM